jgi:hypothetical protein
MDARLYVGITMETTENLMIKGVTMKLKVSNDNFTIGIGSCAYAFNGIHQILAIIKQKERAVLSYY